MRAACLAALVLALALPGCGGGEEDHGPHPGGSATARPAGTSYQPGPGPGPAPGGGGGGYYGGSGFSGGGGGGVPRTAHPHLGGLGGELYAREQRRREAIERAHMGPERLDGTSREEQAARDWTAATLSAHPVTSSDDDTCERVWAQRVATTEAYHTSRHDGLSSATSPRDRTRFLRNCRAQSPAQQQCMDRPYAAAHVDECHELTERTQHDAHEQLQRGVQVYREATADPSG